jgi:hypothetical protein
MNTVCAQTSGFETRMLRICWTRYSPHSGGAAGCSHSASGGTIQETLGRLPLFTSLSKSPGKLGVRPLAISSRPVRLNGLV